MINANRAGARAPADDSPLSLVSRLLWLCPIVGLAAGAVVLWLFGLSLWTAVLFVLLAGCPLVLAWLLLRERRQARGRTR